MARAATLWSALHTKLAHGAARRCCSAPVFLHVRPACRACPGSAACACVGGVMAWRYDGKSSDPLVCSTHQTSARCCTPLLFCTCFSACASCLSCVPWLSRLCLCRWSHGLAVRWQEQRPSGLLYTPN